MGLMAQKHTVLRMLVTHPSEKKPVSRFRPIKHPMQMNPLEVLTVGDVEVCIVYWGLLASDHFCMNNPIHPFMP